jgi:hypothetical protein
MARINAKEALIQIKARCRARCTFVGEPASESDVGALQ